ncbi:polysaccharide deacetylase family protein [Nocardiopsis sp. RSe5-2]|uniref:Polysaccharide deacetylase family protein n=1 Tax=Nocardiopsis endophytica TaxID=3018445 RepID=A0ABT4U125_9ACTN|nr:polysaccharide deacetylase family protein [Nocardiopsis endophytica]MDA2810631.1 polysaccharide deacetylase family protein [Nocardiopsis endophytica]
MPVSAVTRLRTRLRPRHALAAAVALCLLAVPGAAAVVGEGADTPPLATADPQSVPGLELVEHAANDGRMSTAWTYPVVPGAPGFGSEVRTAMAEAHTAFMEERAGQGPAELRQRLDLLAASGDVLGARIVREAVLGGGESRVDGESLWFDGGSGAVLPWTGLLRGEDAVAALDAEVARVLRERDGAEPGELPEGLESDGSAEPLGGTDASGGDDEDGGADGGTGKAPEFRPGDAWRLSTELGDSPLSDLAFDTEGGLVVTLPGAPAEGSGSAGSGDGGSPAPEGRRVEIPAEAATGLLSEFGERARAAALADAPLELEDADAPGRADLDCDRVPCVALTFDDGPGEHTGRLLDTMAEYDAKGTFYLLGMLAGEFPDLASRITEEGHEVGAHSWKHDDLAGKSASGVSDDSVRTAEAIEKASGEWPRTMRPPYGSFNATTKRSVGAPLVLWDVDTLDWQARDAGKVADTALEQTRPGSIVLMHDIHGTTVDAVPEILQRLHAKGYHFVTVSQLFSDLEMDEGTVYRRRE